jgi:ABC-type nitrate/sulfonate/bicarbonate transport system substrate-binding protein
MKKAVLALIFVAILLISGRINAAEHPVLTVALVSTSWNTGLPTAVARGLGYFAQEGLEVRPVTLASSGPIMMALLMSGQAQLVIAGGVAILRGIARGAPVVIVGGHLSRMGYALIGAKGLKSVNDLKGKIIGITGIGGLGEFVVVESLRRNGLAKDRDYMLLNIEGGTAARMAALRAGKVHAVPLTPGQRVQAEKEGLPVLLDTRDSLAEFPSTVVSSTREFTASNPDKVAGFLRALSRGMEFIRNNKDKAIAIGKAQGMRGDLAVERKALDYYADDLDLRLTKSNISALLKIVDGSEPTERYFDDTYLNQALSKK